MYGILQCIHLVFPYINTRIFEDWDHVSAVGREGGGEELTVCITKHWKEIQLNVSISNNWEPAEIVHKLVRQPWLIRSWPLDLWIKSTTLICESAEVTSTSDEPPDTNCACDITDAVSGPAALQILQKTKLFVALYTRIKPTVLPEIQLPAINLVWTNPIAQPPPFSKWFQLFTKEPWLSSLRSQSLLALLPIKWIELEEKQTGCTEEHNISVRSPSLMKPASRCIKSAMPESHPGFPYDAKPRKSSKSRLWESINLTLIKLTMIIHELYGYRSIFCVIYVHRFGRWLCLLLLLLSLRLKWTDWYWIQPTLSYNDNDRPLWYII